MPMAISSEAATTAVGRSGALEEDAGVPGRRVGGPVRGQHPLRPDGEPVGRHRGPEGGEPGLRGLHVGDVPGDRADIGDPLVAESDEVLGRRPHHLGVVDPHAGSPRDGGADGHERQGEPVDEGDLLGTHRHIEGDDAVDPLPQHVLGQGQAPVVGLVLEVEEEDVVAVRPQRLLDRADEGGEEPPGEERRDDGNDPRPPGGEGRRRRRRDVVHLLRDPQHPLPGVRAHPVQAPQGPGHGGDGDPRGPGDIGDGAHRRLRRRPSRPGAGGRAG